MIGKVHPDASFDRLSAYLLQQPGKKSEVLAANGVRVSSAGEMAADFEFQRSTRPDVTMAVEHVSLAWPPSETAILTNEVMKQAAMLYMEKRGIDSTTTQWVLARHHDEDHPHCHLLLNRVTNDGGLVPDKFSKRESVAACRKVEAEMGFVDAYKLGAAKKLEQAEQAGKPAEKRDRLRMKALVVQALEKHLPTVTTMTGLQEALVTEGIGLRVVPQKDQSIGLVFTAEAYPELYMRGSEVSPQYSGKQLSKTLEEQVRKEELEQQDRGAREAKQREAEQQARKAQLLEEETEAQLRDVLLAALTRQVPGATSVAELEMGLAAEGVTARASWQEDGHLQEISFAAGAFPEREMGGAVLGPQYEAMVLSQTLADQAAQRKAEQGEAEELRKLIRAQKQQIADLHEDVKLAELQRNYGKLAEINYGQLPAALVQLTAYQEQAQSTKAGQLVLEELADEAETYAEARKLLQGEGLQALLHPLEEERGDWRSWADYKERVQRRGFDILEGEGQITKLQHSKSGETFNLAELQPGGEEGPALWQRVHQEVKEQEDGRFYAESMLVYLLAVGQFTSASELQQKLKERSYQIQAQPDGQIWLQHETSGRHFKLNELRPNGQDLQQQLQTVATERQAELRRGQVSVGPGPDGSAAERGGQLQRILEAAGAQVIAGTGPAVPGKVVLEYRYEWNGPQLESVNQALRQVQAVPGVLIQEQTKGFNQPEAEWPVRAGEYGRATLIVPASDKDHIETITRKLEEKGGRINEVRPQRNGTVELDIGYQTQQPNFPALNELLDRWAATTKMVVQETAYAGVVRGKVREAGAGAEATPGSDKTIALPAQAEKKQSAGEYERD